MDKPYFMDAILAVSSEGVIGVNNDLPWNIPADLKNFKAVTLGRPIVMGRCTWDSLPFKPLPKRKNVVLTSTAIPNDKVISIPSLLGLQHFLAACEMDHAAQDIPAKVPEGYVEIKCLDNANPDKHKPVLIGGATLYDLHLQHCDVITITTVFDTYIDPNTPEDQITRIKHSKESLIRDYGFVEESAEISAHTTDDGKLYRYEIAVLTRP